MKNFTTFDIAVEFYKSIQSLKLSGDTKDQLHRAARSIALNLAEGRGRRTKKDQVKFFHTAFASLRECQAIFILEQLNSTNQWHILDKLAAHLFRLIEYAR